MNKAVSLSQTVRRGILTPANTALITAIDAHNFDPVTKKTLGDLRRLGLNPTEGFIQRGILALKQYYAVAILDPLNMHAVSAPVDDFWHSHVLFTKAYAEFCSATAGYFMHHEPLDHDNQPEVRNVGRLYRYTLECFDHFFSSVDAEMWPRQVRAEHLICTHFGNSVEATRSRALLPMLAEMQPEAVFVRV